MKLAEPAELAAEISPRVVPHSVASFAGWYVLHHCFPKLRFAAHGANTLPDCFAASFVVMLTGWPSPRRTQA